MGKIKLSDTIGFLSRKLNRVAGNDFRLELDLVTDAVMAGRQLQGRAILTTPEGRSRTLDYLRITLKGQVQQGTRWSDYEQSVDVAHDKSLPENHTYVVPIVINVPLDAVLTEDGASWRLRAQAFIDRTIDPRAEAHFAVLSTGTGRAS
jgi:hypothetical protein